MQWKKVVYNGDLNMTVDRHLGSAWIDKLNQDLVITETTYATTIIETRKDHVKESSSNKCMKPWIRVAKS